MRTAEDALLSDLSDAQRRAVTHRHGALLVLAGPGSGKTTVVTHRIAYLIAQGVAPWQILALTFTNKAAGEMRRRVEGLLPGGFQSEQPPTVATFHSFCARQLRRFADAAGLSPHYSIYDEADRREIVKRAVEDAGLSAKNWTPAAMVAEISRAKNRLVDAEQYAPEASGFYGRSVAQVYRAYEKRMRDADALDFDDLLLHMAALLRKDEPARRRLQQRYQYLLIDEYQDTNHAQFVIAHTLAAAHGNICVVGDPDQSIYGWRGADIGNILEFEEHYPEAEVVPLGQNYRSTGHIVRAADGLIRNNRRRKHKDLFTELHEGDRPTAVVCRDEHHEAALVADYLRNEHEQHGIPWKDMAVLYRINALSRVLEEAFRRARIPYLIARGTAFYERKEVRDALAYLRLVVNPADEVCLRRIINVPARGVGSATLRKVEVFAIHEQLGLFEALARVGRGDGPEGFSARTVKAVGRFVELMQSLRSIAARPAAPGPEALTTLVRTVIGRTGLESMYRSETEEDRQRRANLNELISAASQFEAGEPPEEGEGGETGLVTALHLFLETVALVSDQDAVDASQGAVTLMTLHAAKGLEFSAVALVGLETGLLPHSRVAESEKEMEEERRLCFVGMTRAKRRLLLTRAAVRTLRGMRTRTMGSRFLDELPRESILYSDQAGADFLDEIDGDGRAGRAPESLTAAFPVGCIVRHPKYGLGRVEEVTPRRSGASARVDFPTAGMKTLILDHAPLERVD